MNVWDLKVCLSLGVWFHCTQRYPLRLEEWEDVLGLLLKVAASSSPSLRDSAVSAVAEALDSSLLRRNSNERQRLETVQATLQARY